MCSVARSCILGMRESIAAASCFCGSANMPHLITADGQDTDPLPVVRLFTSDVHATWLLASLYPADDDTAHGMIDLGDGEAVRPGISRRPAQAARDA